MVAAELGLTVGRAGLGMVQCVAKNRLWHCSSDGMYTAISRRPRRVVVDDEPPSFASVTLSPRGPVDVVTDDMLARFGYNL